jgi:hypothetical protein
MLRHHFHRAPCRQHDHHWYVRYTLCRTVHTHRTYCCQICLFFKCYTTSVMTSVFIYHLLRSDNWKNWYCNILLPSIQFIHFYQTTMSNHITIIWWYIRAWKVLLWRWNQGLERPHERVPVQVTPGGQRTPALRYPIKYAQSHTVTYIHRVIHMHACMRTYTVMNTLHHIHPVINTIHHAVYRHTCIKLLLFC